MTVTIRFPEIKKVALFGGAQLMAELLATSGQWGVGWQVKLFSAKRHLDELTYGNESLRDLSSRLRIPVCETENINDCPELLAFVDATTIGLAVGAAWLFERPVAELFGGLLFDVMGIHLPEYRGGAHYTWQILRGDRRAACNIQRIHGGKDTFHKGEIFLRKEYALPESVKTPADYFAVTVPAESAIVTEFFRMVRGRQALEGRHLDETISSYFPFLATKKNGWVDWSWSAEEIIRFVRAFGAPYPGASTRLGGKQVFMHEAELAPEDGEFHPFFSGLVYRIEKSGRIRVACRDRGISLVLRDETGVAFNAGCLEGKRLVSPREDLENALGFAAIYDSNGLKK